MKVLNKTIDMRIFFNIKPFIKKFLMVLIVLFKNFIDFYRLIKMLISENTLIRFLF